MYMTLLRHAPTAASEFHTDQSVLPGAWWHGDNRPRSCWCAKLASRQPGAGRSPVTGAALQQQQSLIQRSSMNDLCTAVVGLASANSSVSTGHASGNWSSGYANASGARATGQWICRAALKAMCAQTKSAPFSLSGSKALRVGRG